MVRLHILFIFLAGLMACRKDDKPPASVVKYKLNDSLVEIRGSLPYDGAGSAIRHHMVKRDASSRVLYLLEARNSSDFLRIGVWDELVAGDTVYYNNAPNPWGPADSIPVSFGSGPYRMAIDFDSSYGFIVVIIDRVSGGTADGRFYGSSVNRYDYPHIPVRIAQGEFKNVLITR